MGLCALSAPRSCSGRKRTAPLAPGTDRGHKTAMGKVIVAIAIGIVFMVLCLGLWTLWKGGAVSAGWSNKLMRIRVLAQFIAILIILAVLYFGQSH